MYVCTYTSACAFLIRLSRGRIAFVRDVLNGSRGTMRACKLCENGTGPRGRMAASQLFEEAVLRPNKTTTKKLYTRTERHAEQVRHDRREIKKILKNKT